MDVVPVAARRVAWRRLIAGLTLTFAWARPLAGAEVTRARCVHPPVFRAHRGTVDRAALGLEILGYAQFHRGSVVVGFNARHLRVARTGWPSVIARLAGAPHVCVARTLTLLVRALLVRQWRVARVV